MGESTIDSEQYLTKINRLKNKNVLNMYWYYYGQSKALFKSPYLYTAIVITFIFYPLWTKPYWWDVVINILPSIIGFSLGGYAILLSFGNESFQKLISGIGENGSISPYMELSASFVHFLIVQYNL